LSTKRVIRSQEATAVKLPDTTIKEYFSVQSLGLAVATIDNTYPPAEKGKWATNDEVVEMLYVIDGEARIVFQDGEAADLESSDAVHLPRGVKYRIENARRLRVVIPTSPAWTPEQHKFSR
jgi:mannose-6-phosphate isomerase-like protein (cupin superfamily)